MFFREYIFFFLYTFIDRGC